MPSSPFYYYLWFPFLSFLLYLIMEAPSFVSKARTAFHSAAAKAERVFFDFKSDPLGMHNLIHSLNLLPLFLDSSFPFYLFSPLFLIPGLWIAEDFDKQVPKDLVKPSNDETSKNEDEIRVLFYIFFPSLLTQFLFIDLCAFNALCFDVRWNSIIEAAHSSLSPLILQNSGNCVVVFCFDFF